MDYSSILHRAWELTKKNKWLWVYGLALALFGQVGNGGGGGGGSSDKQPGELPKNLPDLPKQTSQVLGQATNFITQWAADVPVSTWILIGSGIFLLVIFAIALAMIIQNWAKGALISGLADADNGKTVDLPSTSPSGIKSLKRLIVFSLIAAIVSLGLILGSLILMGIAVGGGYLLFSFSKIAQIVWLVLSITAAVLTLIGLIILISMVGIYADRLIVLENYNPWPAWKEGLKLSKGSFLDTLKMGIINSSVGCAAGCLSTIIQLIVLGIPALIIILPSFKNGWHWPAPPAIIGLTLLFITFIYTNLLFRAILTVFRFGVWNLFVKTVRQQK